MFGAVTLAFDGFGWADRGTSSTIGALACIDCVDGIALANCVNGALRKAGAAGDTFVGNFVCHSWLLS